MLESIVINNFAIIDKTHIEYARGMTALTGETGAGKSILLDAIQLVLGDRADSNSVKAGCDKADISVSFDTSALADANAWLQQNELADEHSCLLRRVIHSNGRSKAFINGSPVTLGQLRELGEMLVDLHGQHEHQSLQKSSVQRELVDASLPEPQLLAATRESFTRWQQLQQRQRQMLDQSQEKQQRIDLLQLYSREFAELSLVPGEYESLQKEYRRLSHAGQILEISSEVNARLYDNEPFNIQAELSVCVEQLQQLAEIDHSLKDTQQLLQDALIQTQEAASFMRAYHQDIDLDPARLDWINQRLSQAQSLARKHHVSEEDLVEHAQALQQELEQLQVDEADIDKIEQQLEQAYADYLKQATALSEARQQTAGLLSQQISEEMQNLGMQGGCFEIRINRIEQPGNLSGHGIDQIQFLVSANPGQPLKPLTKVASGGELSRISLAIQVILSSSSQIPTLIFDEVDSGIGGGIAEIVGNKLRQIAANRQVFCVTHLPQVASQAHHHYQVQKTKHVDSVTTDVRELEQQQRLEEIARMLGGMTITEQTRAHAQEMIGKVG